MGIPAKIGLIVAMVVLVLAVQLFEREVAARRPPAGAKGAAGPPEPPRDGPPLAVLLAPLEDAPLPDVPREDVPLDSPVPPARAAGRTYVVQAGDTLAKIAKKTLGRESAWQAIYDANRSAIRDPGRLQVGATLRIPAAGAASGPARELTRGARVR